jgi:hypothetical protein
MPSSALSAEHIGNYYALQPQLLPEAFQPLHNAFYSPPLKRDAPKGEAQQLPRKGGCAGLQQEVQAANCMLASSKPTAHASITALPGSPTVMWRAAIAELSDRLLGGGQQAAQSVLLRGASGSGKSVAVAALVEQARANGW